MLAVLLSSFLPDCCLARFPACFACLLAYLLAVLLAVDAVQRGRVCMYDTTSSPCLLPGLLASLLACLLCSLTFLLVCCLRMISCRLACLSACFLARVPTCLPAFFAWLQLTLYNAAGDKVAKMENLESGGLTEDFEEFYFNEAVMGSKIRIDLRGTTAGLWNGIAEVRLPVKSHTSQSSSKSAFHSSAFWKLFEKTAHVG